METHEEREVSHQTRYEKAREHLAEAYNLLCDLIGTDDALETITSAIDEVYDLEKGE
jgi:hypothetical protein